MYWIGKLAGGFTVAAQAQEEAGQDAGGLLALSPAEVIELAVTIAGTVAVVVVLALALWFAHRRLLSYYAKRPNQQFRRQLIMLGLFLFALLLAIIFVPIRDENLRGQLLQLYGIVLSATIALSSTTLVGNAMAGIMLRTLRNFTPGDYVKVGDYFGRISEMDLLHTEIQTEERDLTTLPNLYMVTHPVRVLRGSGTILSVPVSLGYDVPRGQVEKLLRDAATECGLESPFVQIRDLGDYSVTYAVAGLLTDLKILIQKRRELRARTMDALHGAGIEIASPAILSKREFPVSKTFIPRAPRREEAVVSGTGPDSIVFDKAEKAESLAKLKERFEEFTRKLKEVTAAQKAQTEEKEAEALAAEKVWLEKRLEWLQVQIERQESKMAEDS